MQVRSKLASLGSSRAAPSSCCVCSLRYLSSPAPQAEYRPARCVAAYVCHACRPASSAYEPAAASSAGACLCRTPYNECVWRLHCKLTDRPTSLCRISGTSIELTVMCAARDLTPADSEEPYARQRESGAHRRQSHPGPVQARTCTAVSFVDGLPPPPPAGRASRPADAWRTASGMHDGYDRPLNPLPCSKTKQSGRRRRPSPSPWR